MLAARAHRFYIFLCLMIGIWVAIPTAVLAGDADLKAARAARLAGDFVTAEDALKRHLSSVPNDAEAMRRLAEILGFQQKFNEALETILHAQELEPNNRDITLTHARVLAWSARFQEARHVLDTLLKGDPDNVEYQALSARIYYYQGRLIEAEKAYRKVLGIRPDDLDALVGMGDVQRAMGREEQARTHYGRAEAVAPDNVDVQERLASDGPKIDNPFEVRVGLSITENSRLPLADWTEFSFTGRYQASTALSFGLEVKQSERFGLKDTFLAATVSKRWNGRLQTEVGFGVTPQDDFLPEFELRGGLAYTLRDQGGAFSTTILGLNGSLRDYAGGTVKALNPEIQQYFADGRAWLTARWINSWDTTDVHSDGYFLRGDVYLHDEFRLFGGYASAPETDRGVVTETQAWFIGLYLPFGERFFGEVSYGENDRQASYFQKSLQFTLGTRF